MNQLFGLQHRSGRNVSLVEGGTYIIRYKAIGMP